MNSAFLRLAVLGTALVSMIFGIWRGAATALNVLWSALYWIRNAAARDLAAKLGTTYPHLLDDDRYGPSIRVKFNNSTIQQFNNWHHMKCVAKYER